MKFCETCEKILKKESPDFVSGNWDVVLRHDRRVAAYAYDAADRRFATFALCIKCSRRFEIELNKIFMVKGNKKGR